MKKRFALVLTLVIVLLMAYVLKDIDFIEAYNILRQINPIYFWLSFFSGMFCYLTWSLRFKITLSNLVKTNYFFTSLALMSGIFVNTITPGTGIGGEPIRAYFLSKKYKKPKTEIFASILADKIFQTTSFLILIIISLLFVFPLIKIPITLKIIIEAIIILALLSIISRIIYKKTKPTKNKFLKLLFKIKLIKKHFKNYSEFRLYLDKKIKNFISILKKSLQNKKKFTIGILLSFILWTFRFLIPYFLFLAIGYKINFFSILIVVTIGYLIGDLSPIPGGIGLMEGTMFLLYSAMGVVPEIAAIVSLLTRLIDYFYALIIGGLSLIWLKINLK